MCSTCHDERERIDEIAPSYVTGLQPVVTNDAANVDSTICGDYSEEDTPVPIPNTEVKLLSADDTWWETAWESRTLPFF